MNKVAIVVAGFDKEIANLLLKGANQAWSEHFSGEPKTIWVPGAVEIPCMVANIIDDYDAVLCLGAVIQGETRHFDYVCKIAAEGCLQLAITSKKPVTFGVLTTNNRQQALERAGGKKGNKGYDTMLCTLDMLATINNLDA